MFQRFIVLALFVIPVSLFAADKIYTWTDEDGNIFYGDRPPMEVEATEIAIQGKKKAALTVSDELVPGKWFGETNNGGQVKITLHDTGAVSFIQTRADQSVYNYQGIWTLDNTTITIITEFSQSAPRNGEMERSVEPVQITYTIISFNDDSMELISGEERFLVNRLPS